MDTQKCFLILLLLLISCVESKYMVYDTTSKVVPGKLNVHLVPHTHDDILGKYSLRIDPLGEGARWPRSYVQEIYSPFILAFAELQDGETWTNTHVATFFWDGSLVFYLTMLQLQVSRSWMMEQFSFAWHTYMRLERTRIYLLWQVWS
ncbi:hypothetical protein POPTR_012G106401v4 [Populus trichocarpa]|uniref:Uncharacterized protein n=1 Tax=Populus trichocarpa TaxID=3694 RepID=A0ACC0S5C2_POPTR|nr:hypothetical protein POPTR_012G106401v4 [Populus trichocarpa]